MCSIIIISFRKVHPSTVLWYWLIEDRRTPARENTPLTPPPAPPLFLSHIPNIHISCKHIIEDRGTSPVFQHFINCFKWYESQDLDKLLPFFDVFWMYPLSPFIRLIPSFFKKQKLLMWYTYWGRFPDMGSVVLQF